MHHDCPLLVETWLFNLAVYLSWKRGDIIPRHVKAVMLSNDYDDTSKRTNNEPLNEYN